MDKKQLVAILIAVVATFLIMMIESQKMEDQRKAAQAAHAQQEAEQQGKPSSTPKRGTVATTPAQPRTEEAADATAASTPKVAPAVGTSTPPAEEARLLVTTPNYEVEFSSRGGSVIRYTLNNHTRTPEKSKENRLTLLDEVRESVRSLNLRSIAGVGDLYDRNFEVVSLPQSEDPKAPRTLVYRTTVDGWEVTKTYTLPAVEPEELAPEEAYGFRMAVSIRNTRSTDRELGWTLQAVAGMMADDPMTRFGPLESLSATVDAAKDRGAIEREPVSSRLGDWDRAANTWKGEPLVRNQAGLSWMGLRGRYFAAVLRVETPEHSGGVSVTPISLVEQYRGADGDGGVHTFVPYVERQREALEPFVGEQPYSASVSWESLKNQVKAGQVQETAFRFYGGPIKEEMLAHEPAFKHLVTYSAWNFSLLEWISEFLVGILSWLQEAGLNTGFCIILLTLIIKTALHGLTRKSLKSTHAMQQLQPQLKELKEKYKSDPAKMQSETMRLWRENGVSPMGPCFPMFIQIPIFFSLYGVFANVFAMRQAHFIPGWIDDLSQPDALFNLPFAVPLAGWTTFNLLPILYVVLQFIQMSMSPKSDDPQQQQMQQTMKIMPLMFMFIFYNMPSGLVLYFTISAGYTLTEHWFIRKQLAAKSGDGGGTSAAPAAAGKGFKKKK
ncbi:MAG: membrane protein insertase YidC [Planctomycetota bacterium]|jgi:YidC/Oxa1 family membrane protein insertase